jgi:hypothetical protein
MADEPPPCEGYTRIKARAENALNDINGLLTRFLEPEDLRLGLEDVKQDLDAILMDNHTH